MVDLPAVIVTGTVIDHVTVIDHADHDRDHVVIVANIATDHHLHIAVDHHLHTNANVDPDLKNASASILNE